MPRGEEEVRFLCHQQQLASCLREDLPGVEDVQHDFNPWPAHVAAHPVRASVGVEAMRQSRHGGWKTPYGTWGWAAKAPVQHPNRNRSKCQRWNYLEVKFSREIITCIIRLIVGFRCIQGVSKWEKSVLHFRPIYSKLHSVNGTGSVNSKFESHRASRIFNSIASSTYTAYQ